VDGVQVMVGLAVLLNRVTIVDGGSLLFFRLLLLLPLVIIHCSFPFSSIILRFINPHVDIIAAGVNSSFQLKSNVDDLSEIARDIDGYKTDVVTSGYLLEAIVDATIVNVKTIKSQAADQPDIVNECNKASTVLSNARREIDRYISIVPDDSATPFINDVEEGVKHVPMGHVGLGVLFIGCLLFIVG
jgi:hypothetical protein